MPRARAEAEGDTGLEGREEAARAVAKQLRDRRAGFPPIMRGVLLAGLAYVLLYGSILAFLYVVDRELFADMVRLYGLTLLAGREPAMLAAYQPPTPVPLGWMIVVAILDDVGTLLLTLTWVWWGFHRLRGVGLLQNWLLDLEKAALHHRAWLRRWGLAGLAAFFWLPGFGSGVLAICVMGVLSHIPLRRLVPTLVIAAASVATFWAVALHQTSLVLRTGPVQYLPAALIAVVIILSLASAFRHRRTAHLILLEWPSPVGPRREALGRFGLRAEEGVVEVDARVLGQALGSTPLGRPRARRLAELLLLDGMTPDAALALERAGIGGILDVATLDPPLVASVLAQADVPSAGRADAWNLEAKALAGKLDSLWRRTDPA
ncbi:MAG: hypothetical protein HYT80_09705 [Euryarchaeota archaeon]|nr:hypothetical protein [Euryarchaeota archaeon]